LASRLAGGHALPEVRGEVLGPVAKADATAVRSVDEGGEAMTPEERARHAAGMRCLCVVGECGGCITCRVAAEIRAAVAEEREACARIAAAEAGRAEDEKRKWQATNGRLAINAAGEEQSAEFAAKGIRDAIRARGDK